jgi:DNA topoisomerase-1
VAKPLVIVESGAKAKTIAGFLGADNYTVMASVGHIRDLPRGAKYAPKNITKPEVRRLGIDVDDHFSPVYVVPDDKKQVVSQLKAALKDASELYLATDEDREGESIAWHLLEVLKPRVPVKRMVFHEITSEAIQEAIANWRDLDMKLVEAQEGRRTLDRLYGYEVSNVAFRRIGPGTSAGRVQSVATRLVVDRERARMAFHRGSYWDLEGTFGAEDAATFPATLVQLDGRRLASGRDFDAATGRLNPDADGALLDEPGAATLATRLEDQPFTVASVETRAHTERPKAPFITSTLQQEAGRKLGFSSARTMHVAQGLYERGLITYMRTDSTSLSAQAVSAARNQIRSMYGEAYPPTRSPVPQQVKNAQEAHEAIRAAGDRMRTVDDVAHDQRY